ncbi:MAG: hypothetical protein AAB353_11325 [Candidatus Hydrogenedentota bacterium]
MSRPFGRRYLFGLIISLLFVTVINGCPGGRGEVRIAVAWNATGGDGKVAFIRPGGSFAFDGAAIAVGENSTLAARGGKVYAVSRTDGTITVIAASKGAVDDVIDLGPAAQPIDMAIVSARTAYVSRATATHLLRVDLRNGSSEEVVDLSSFADADDGPDLGTMAIHDGRLFVQIMRFNPDVLGSFEPPAMIAVVDIASEELVDADPAVEGVQAIELEGTAPKTRMQVIDETNELFVSATGGFFDDGGLEVIDLGTLDSKGLVIPEDDGLVGADLGAFTLVDSDRGYLIFSTDLTLSSHLVPFSVTNGVDPGPQLNVSVDYFAPALASDPDSETLYVPEGDFGERGIHVFDTSTNERLTDTPIPTDGQPTDLLRITGR